MNRSSIQAPEPALGNVWLQAVMALPAGATLVDAADPDQPIVFCNPAFEELSGYRQHEIIGNNCRFLQGEDRAQEGVDEIRRALAQGRGCRVVLRNYRKDGSRFRNRVTMTPLTTGEGPRYVLGIQEDLDREGARRREVDVATGLLMERHMLTRQAALGTLRAQARSRRRTMGDLSRDLIAAADLLNDPAGRSR